MIRISSRACLQCYFKFKGAILSHTRISLGLIHLLATILTSYTMYTHSPALLGWVRCSRHQHNRNTIAKQVVDESHTVTGVNKDICCLLQLYNSTSRSVKAPLQAKTNSWCSEVESAWRWTAFMWQAFWEKEALTMARCLSITFMIESTESSMSQKEVVLCLHKGQNSVFIHRVAMTKWL